MSHLDKIASDLAVEFKRLGVAAIVATGPDGLTVQLPGDAEPQVVHFPTTALASIGELQPARNPASQNESFRLRDALNVSPDWFFLHAILLQLFPTWREPSLHKRLVPLWTAIDAAGEPWAGLDPWPAWVPEALHKALWLLELTARGAAAESRGGENWAKIVCILREIREKGV